MIKFKKWLGLAVYKIGYRICGLGLSIRGIERKKFVQWWLTELQEKPEMINEVK